MAAVRIARRATEKVTELSSSELKNRDVVVVGGGVIGLALARELAGADLRVILLERGSFGGESSWAGAGIIEAGSIAKQEPMARLRRRSCRMFADFAAALSAETGCDVEFERSGALDLVFDGNQEMSAEREVAASRECDDPFFANVERVSDKRLRRMAPALGNHCDDALYVPHEAQVRNPRMTQALTQACHTRGVSLHENCAVARLLFDAERVVGVETVRGEKVHADIVIDSAGAWANTIDDALSARINTLPVRGQMVLIKAEPQLFTQVIRNGSTYLVPRRDGHILIGATVEPKSGFQKNVSAKVVKKFLRVAIKTVPALADATFVRAWAGLRPGSPDGMPHLGPVPEMPGLVAACGHYRSGITLTPATVELISAYVRTRTISDALRPFLPSGERRRPKRAAALQ